MHPFAKAALGAVAAAYANHALVRPGKVATLARTYANRVGKPMLTFVPPPGATLKSIFMNPLALGDVNLHPDATGRDNGPGQIGRGTPYRIPVAPRSFACIFSFDTLEHLDRPDLALMEWHRVADKVFIVAPPWWTPEAWLNKWYIDPELRRAWPVWASQSRTVWLPGPTRRAYDAGTCRTPQTPMVQGRPARPEPQQITSTTSPPVTESTSTPGIVSNESAPQAESLPIVNLILQSTTPPTEEEDLRTEEDLLSSGPQQDLPFMPAPAGSPSSTSVSSMMIMSGPDSESD